MVSRILFSGYLTELPMEIQKILKSMDFHVKRKDIIEQAKKSRALLGILKKLGMLPDREYNNAEDIARELHIIHMGIPT